MKLLALIAAADNEIPELAFRPVAGLVPQRTSGELVIGRLGDQCVTD
jgi:hypothetical protein